MSKVVIEITEQYVITQDILKGVVKHAKGKFPNFVKVGDFVQYVEHGFHDIIDQKGKIIRR